MSNQPSTQDRPTEAVDSSTPATSVNSGEIEGATFKPRALGEPGVHPYYIGSSRILGLSNGEGIHPFYTAMPENILPERIPSPGSPSPVIDLGTTHLPQAKK